MLPGKHRQEMFDSMYQVDEVVVKDHNAEVVAKQRMFHVMLVSQDHNAEVVGTQDESCLLTEIQGVIADHPLITEIQGVIADHPLLTSHWSMDFILASHWSNALRGDECFSQVSIAPFIILILTRSNAKLFMMLSPSFSSPTPRTSYHSMSSRLMRETGPGEAKLDMMAVRGEVNIARSLELRPGLA